jgi:hypothetical protein
MLRHSELVHKPSTRDEPSGLYHGFLQKALTQVLERGRKTGDRHAVR